MSPAANKRFWEFVERFGAAAFIVFAYVVGLFPLWLVFLAIEGEGGPPDVWVPYLLAYGLLFGAVTGRWWLLPFPFLHLFVVEPLRTLLKHGGIDVTYAYDREAMAIAATLGLLAGVLANRLIAALVHRFGGRGQQLG